MSDEAVVGLEVEHLYRFEESVEIRSDEVYVGTEPIRFRRSMAVIWTNLRATTDNVVALVAYCVALFPMLQEKAW